MFKSIKGVLMKKFSILFVLILFLTMTGYNSSAEEIDSASGELNITELKDYQKRYVGEEVDVCSKNSTKTYMDYRAITSRSSKQYKFIHEYMIVDEDSGFLYDEEGFIGVALGSFYGAIGDRYYITLDSGIVLPLIKIEEKADKDTVNGCAHTSDSSVIEFVIDTEYAAESEYFNIRGNGLIMSGNYNNYKLFKGKIDKIEKVTDELNDNYVEYVEKDMEEFDNQDIFQYASGY